MLYGALSAIGILTFAGCAGPGYTSATVAYDYDYYPSSDVYYYPHERVYYWNDAGHWRSGRGVPNHYQLHEQEREHLQLHTRQPWTEHAPEHPEFQGHYPNHH